MQSTLRITFSEESTMDGDGPRHVIGELLGGYTVTITLVNGDIRSGQISTGDADEYKLGILTPAGIQTIEFEDIVEVEYQ